MARSRRSTKQVMPKSGSVRFARGTSRVGGGGIVPKASKGSRANGNSAKQFSSRPHGSFTNPRGSKGKNTRGGKGGAFGSNPGSVRAARPMVKVSGKVKTRWSRG